MTASTPDQDQPHPTSSTLPEVTAEWTTRRPGAPTLVWLHGIGSSSTRGFAAIARSPVLAEVDSLLIDLAGHGGSPRPTTWDYHIEHQADAVAQAIARYLSGPCVVMGHSLGGSVAIALAFRHPALVTCLIAAEPTLDPGRGIVSARIARQSEEDFVQTGYARLIEATSRLAAQGSLQARAWLPDLRRSLPEALHRTSVSLLADREPTFRQQLVQLSVPALLITGELSTHIAAPFAAPHLRGYVVPGAAHHLAIDNPTGFAAILASIIRSHDPGNTPASSPFRS